MSERHLRDRDGATSPLRVRLRIAPDPELSCGILAAGSGVTAASRTSVCPDESCATGCECRAVVSRETNDRQNQQLVSSQLSDNCVCPAFDQNGCIAEIEGVNDGMLVVTATMGSRTALRSLIEDLRSTGATVGVESIVPLDATDARDGVDRQLFDVSSVTEKQREAVTIAVEAGYYEQPRRCDLDELADRLGVSRSAASQRLNTAEAKLVKEFNRRIDSTVIPGQRPGKPLAATPAD